MQTGVFRAASVAVAAEPSCPRACGGIPGGSYQYRRDDKLSPCTRGIPFTSPTQETASKLSPFKRGLLPPLDPRPDPQHPATDGCTISGVPVASTSILPSGWHQSASNLPTEFGDALDLSTATAWGGWGGRGCFACLGSDTKEGRERCSVPAELLPWLNWIEQVHTKH